MGKGVTTSFDIIDGQQRLTALRDFAAGKFQLLETSEDSKLRLPKSLCGQDAPWAGKFYDGLSTDLRRKFLDTELTVFEISSAQDDEVRDLFIRLQSGTALTRQQVRDAWPGNMADYIVKLAGKFNSQPRLKLFGDIDKRGQGNQEEDDEQKDPHVGDRQTCAQLLKIFLERAGDPYAFPSTSARDLDDLYREQTAFDENGEAAKSFVEILEAVGRVFEHAKQLRDRQTRKKKKLTRLDVTVVMMHIQDLKRNPQIKMDRRLIEQLADKVITGQKLENKDKPVGKRVRGAVLKDYYRWWREDVCKNEPLGTRLDKRRKFSDEQKTEIYDRDDRKCSICSEKLDFNEAEFDHYPVPWRDGGRTEINNGRLVCSPCHPRGRPNAED